MKSRGRDHGSSAYFPEASRGGKAATATPAAAEAIAWSCRSWLSQHRRPRRRRERPPKTRLATVKPDGQSGQITRPTEEVGLHATCREARLPPRDLAGCRSTPERQADSLPQPHDALTAALSRLDRRGVWRQQATPRATNDSSLKPPGAKAFVYHLPPPPKKQRLASLSPPPLRLRLRRQRRDQLFVQPQQVFDPLPFRREPRAAVEPVHRTIQRLMRLAQVRWHDVRVVQVGERGIRVRGACV